MYDVWKVKEPRLIMCIIGGAKYFKLNERLEKEFIKGIIQAALKAGKRTGNKAFKLTRVIACWGKMDGLSQLDLKQVLYNLSVKQFMIIK